MTKPLWTSVEAVTATKGVATKDFTATGVSIDTRTLQPGDLFVALKGEHLDGHDYVAQAFAAGASAALVSKDYVSPNPEWTLLVVDDTTTAMEDLGRAARHRCKGTVVGVAGSVGKTGTKEMLATLFGALGKTHASKKSFNNHWGVPLTLANLPADAEFAVIEIGMNHPGEITNLTDQARPDIAIITTIDKEHVEFFNNGLEGIADANAEIFLGMNSTGIAILNIDNDYFARLKTHADKRGIKNIIAFGEDDDAQSRLLDVTLHSDGSKVTAEIMGEKVSFRLNIPGRHIVMNALGALAVVKAAGGDLKRAVAALEKASAVAGRGNRYQIVIEPGQPPVTVIDESYNANPASVEAALGVFAMVEPAAGGRRLAVLGDMLELGPQGPKMHVDLANAVLKAKTDLLYCCGPLMDALYQALPDGWRGAHEKESKALADRLVKDVKPGDVILVKGSAGSKMGYIIQALQNLQPPSNNKGIKNAL